VKEKDSDGKEKTVAAHQQEFDKWVTQRHCERRTTLQAGTRERTTPDENAHLIGAVSR
jgi:hypothetical protein